MGCRMFNRSEIMKAAWAMWNSHYDARPHLERGFEIEEFGFYLSIAWRNAKEAAMSAKEARSAAIAREIENLKFASLRIDVEAKRQRLSAELAAITA
jgi:hypothetical protein